MSWPAAILLLALAGCGEGYSSATGANGTSPEADPLMVLRRAVAQGDSAVRAIARPGPCTLEVRWSEAPAREYDLLRLDTLADTDASGLFTVVLQPGGDAPSPLLVATPDWATMLVVRSAVNQLRADCAQVRAEEEG